MHTEVIQVQPTGWESDPEDEYFKLSTLDYCVGQVFVNYALFFKLSDDDKPKTIPVLKRGLEITLSQCRQLCGILEPHPDGGLAFHKKRESTVEFHVQWLDGPDDEGNSPSFEDLEKRHFVSQALGDINTWCVAPMTYGEKPEAMPTSRPKASAFKATFIRGGLVFMMHHHHYANDVMGWAGTLHQLAENCAAIWKSPDNPALPLWDPTCLDLSRVTVPDPPENERVDGPATPPRHPDHKVGQLLLFHLPKDKAAELKQLATPEDKNHWISTYDAYMALIWRVLTKHRAKLFNPDPTQPLFWGEAVDLRRRFRDPPMPERAQGNMVGVALSTQIHDAVPPLTVAEVIREAPLSKLAWYIRQLTSSITEPALAAMLAALAPIRDKTSLVLRIDSFAPTSSFVTDWRSAEPCTADFGFGRPHAFRCPFDTVTAGLTVVYPPRTKGEGNEFCVALERELVAGLLEDEEWGWWFEFRGVDAEEGVAGRE